MKVYKIIRNLSFMMLLLLLFACHSKPEQSKKDTPTSGVLNIGADESFAPIVTDEADMFMAIYPESKINIRFKSEADAITDFINRKESFIIIARPFNDDELNYLKQSDYPPRQILIASDAVALVVNAMNSDSNLTYKNVSQILGGKVTDWNQLNAKSLQQKISLIFDNSKSSMLRYLKEEILKSDSVSKQIYAADSIPAVVSYVRENSSAVGVVGVSWLNDLTDDSLKSFLEGVKLAGISNPDSSDTKFYRPESRFLMSRAYPLMRNIYVIHRQEGASLGAGFASYIASDEGQTIIERSGLVPAHQPLRVIEIKNQF